MLGNSFEDFNEFLDIHIAPTTNIYESSEL